MKMFIKISVHSPSVYINNFPLKQFTLINILIQLNNDKISLFLEYIIIFDNFSRVVNAYQVIHLNLKARMCDVTTICDTENVNNGEWFWCFENHFIR
jgi:hypothetical protein